MLKHLIQENLFSRNIAAIQLLGLCPLLAMSNSIQTAVLLSLASAVVLIFSAVVISCIRRFIPETTRLPIFVLVIATFTTTVVLLVEAFAFTLYTQVALFLQIIVTNCMILGRINQVSSKNPPLYSTLDAITTSLGFCGVLIFLGIVREFGSLALPIMAYPVGAFVTFGLLLALFQWLSSLYESNQTQIQKPELAPRSVSQ